IHLGLCLLLRDTRLEPSQRVKKVFAAVVIVRIGDVDNQRHPHVHMLTGWELQLKRGRHYANHCNLMPIERHILIYDARIRTKLSLPQIVTDDCREWTSWCF